MLWSELRLILKTSSVTPDFFFTFFIESYHFLPSVKVLKKSVCGKFLGANVLKALKCISVPCQDCKTASSCVNLNTAAQLDCSLAVTNSASPPSIVNNETKFSFHRNFKKNGKEYRTILGPNHLKIPQNPIFS